MLKIGVIGCGYWGPKLIRNFMTYSETELIWACDLDEKRLDKISSLYPSVQRTTDLDDLLADEGLDGVAIATPVNSHFPIAKAFLEKGKHVLVEKPMASTVQEGEELVKIARKNNLQIMCDHIFCYTGAARKIKEVIQSATLGELLYFDSVRVNLGLFQPDVNVVWDLASHDISLVDYLVDEKPVLVSAHGVSHTNSSIENVAYITLRYESNFIAHFHVNWLSPVKIRMTMICGTEKMLVWNDIDEAEKIKIYDKGIEVTERDLEQRERLLISYRSGDMHAPRVDRTEALALVVKEFADCILNKRPALTGGEAGLRVLRVLEAANLSMKAGGSSTPINYP
jgi:predicted dehydrogenase